LKRLEQGNPHLKLALTYEMEQLLRREELALELIDVLDFNFQWLLRFCERNRIEIPDRERLYQSLNKVRVLMREISPEMKCVQVSPDNGREPKNGIR